MNKVLIVTYYWPPSGGAGVQRWLKFSKYLPELGWEPIILTVDPAYAAYPFTDDSLTNELPSSLKIYKTPSVDYFSIYKKDKSRIPAAGFANSVDNTLKGKTLRFIRGNFFIPDPRRGWNKYGYKKACEIIGAEGIKHVITTSPPHSTQLIGLKIKTKYPDIKWIADLRDPWTDIYYYEQFYPTFISRCIDSGFERRVLKSADNIITVGSSLKEIFSLKTKGITEKIVVIPNGFDTIDFKDIKLSYPTRFTLTYVGTLSDIYPVGSLINALKSFREEGKDFILRFVGTISEKARELIRSSIPDESIEFIPNVTHGEAIEYMMSSTVLILIIPLHKSNKSIVTGKLFEYLAVGRPILCIGPPDGDAAEIIKKCMSGVTADYSNTVTISDFLRNFKGVTDLPYKPAIKDYSRLNLAKHLVFVLSSPKNAG
jgi:glycosyltransferase involved in cell wall biosynthesis